MGTIQQLYQTGNPVTYAGFPGARPGSLLGMLSAESRTWLEQYIGRPKILQRKQRLFMSGQNSDGLYLINSGSLKAYVESDSGEEQITGFHFANDVLGLDGLENGLHTYTVEALETVSVSRISFNVLEQLVGRDPQLHQLLLKKISQQIGNEHMTIFMLGRMNAEQRLAQFFLKLSSVMRDSGRVADQITLSMPRNDIANYLGLALETVSRLLTRFQNSGLLKVAHRQVQLLDAAGLQHIVKQGDQRLAQVH
ncbi:MAG TPA: helix-turn-helix domain-containing protein [Gammaproteobacteria bacterium]